MNLGSFRILLTFFQTSWGVGILNSAIFNRFHMWVEFGTILEGLRNFDEGGLTLPGMPENFTTFFSKYLGHWRPKFSNF